jgi:Domain of unknown function (DUF397)
MEHPTWRNSSFGSGQDGHCVEAANLPDGYRAVQNSKDPAGSALIVTAAEWSALTAGLQVGEFG